MEFEMGFMEKSRVAWEAKMATIEKRCMERVKRNGSISDFRRAKFQSKAQNLERCQNWMPAVAVALAMQSLHEVLVLGRISKFLSRLQEPLRQEVEDRVTWQEERFSYLAIPNCPRNVLRARRLWTAAQRLLFGHVARALTQGAPSPAAAAATAPSSRSASHLAPGQHRRNSLRLQAGLKGKSPCQLLLARRAHFHLASLRLRHAAVGALVLPPVRLLALGRPYYGEACAEWQSFLDKARTTVRDSQRLQLKWGILLRCVRAILLFSWKIQRHKSGTIILSFILKCMISNHLLVACKHTLTSVKKIQRAMRGWLEYETTKRRDTEDLFYRCEVSLLKKRWSEHDKALIDRERKLLDTESNYKERKARELMINITVKNLQLYKRPKTEVEADLLEKRIQAHRVPPALTAFCIQQVLHARKILRDYMLRERKKREQKYVHDMQIWSDIEQAVKLIDPVGSNPAHQPSKPAKPAWSGLKAADVASIVQRLNDWYVEHKDVYKDEIARIPRLQSKRKTRSRKWEEGEAPDVVCSAVRDIVHSVLLAVHVPADVKGVKELKGKQALLPLTQPEGAPA